MGATPVSYTHLDVYKRQINSHTRLNTILYADDQIIIQKSEGNLQRSVYLLGSWLPSEYNVEITTFKTKVMVFEGEGSCQIKSNNKLGNN